MNHYADMIKDYLKIHVLSIEMMACICRISPASIYSILNGRRPGPLISKKIFIATKGKVNLNIPYRTHRLNFNGSKKIYSETAMVRHKREE